MGHSVHLVDPVPLHVEQAEAAGVTAEQGDARRLAQESESVDAVLLLGPLYHLLDKGDRLRALSEARRVLKPNGILFAAAISRVAALLDLLVRLDRLHESGVLPIVEEALHCGHFRGSEGGLFTTAYFHRPSELQDEITAAGFHAPRVFNVEGLGFLAANFGHRWADPSRREAMMDAARLTEEDPDVRGAASHLLAVAFA